MASMSSKAELPVDMAVMEVAITASVHALYRAAHYAAKGNDVMANSFLRDYERAEEVLEELSKRR